MSTYRSDNAVRLTVVLNIDTDIPWIAQATAAAAMRDAFGSLAGATHGLVLEAPAA